MSRLVLIDDEPRNLDILEAHLEDFAVELERFTDGRVALAAMIEQPPDLVLLDLVMPGFDGLDVLNHIRSVPALAAIPVILVTAHTERERRLQGIEAGADEFLEKPIDGSILKARVRTLLRLKEHHDDLVSSRHALRATNSMLERRNEDLLRAQQTQRELMGFIVHDLKTPLTTVFLALQYGARRVEALDPLLHQTLRDGLTSANRVKAMIDDLLAVSLLEEARMPLRRESISVSALLEAATGLCSGQAAEKHIALELAPGRELQIDGDRALLLRVIQNLLDNSMRFTPPDGRIAVEAHDDAGVSITVSNNGPPIPEAERARIFEKFVRDPGGRGGSAGLGLYFCRCALEAHHGDIRVVERPEWPTSFEIWLPHADAPAANAGSTKRASG